MVPDPEAWLSLLLSEPDEEPPAEGGNSVVEAESHGERCLEPAPKCLKRSHPPTSTTWAERLANSLADAKATRGQQQRPLVLSSACSGLGSHCRGLQDVVHSRL